MTADKQTDIVKTGKEKVRRGIQGFWKWLVSPPIEPLDGCADWYGGLAVDANSFSQQLIRLRAALQPDQPPGAVESDGPKPVESSAIEFGPESAG